jgi:hypothetical protein
MPRPFIDLRPSRLRSQSRQTGLKFLESRAEKFAKSEIIEAAWELGLGELYLQKIGELREILLQLLGLGWICRWP